MKLSPELKEFYLRCLVVPIVGKPVFGPLLRGIWKTMSFFDRSAPAPVPAADGLITTYASTISSLRNQVETFERRMEQLDREVAELRASGQVSSLLLSAALEGLARRAVEHDESTRFHQRVNGAALSALKTSITNHLADGAGIPVERS